MPTKIRLAARVPDPLSRAGIAAYLRVRPDIELLPDDRLAEAGVVLLVADALTARVVEELRELSARTSARFVLVADRLGDADPLALVELGVVGVTWRADATGERLARLVISAAQGVVDLPREVQSRLVADVARLQRTVLAPKGLTASGLEDRELDVLRFLSEGLDTAEIATKMRYSERTVKGILYNVTNRLCLRNRVHAVAHAIRAGVL